MKIECAHCGDEFFISKPVHTFPERLCPECREEYEREIEEAPPPTEEDPDDRRRRLLEDGF